MDVLLFGDQTADQTLLLRKIFLRKGNGLLPSFLERVSVVLREEVRILPRLRRERIPKFLTVANLVERYVELDYRCPEVDSALLTISQLGHYIGQVIR